MILFFTPKKGLIDWANKRQAFDFLLEHEGKEMFANMGKVKGVRSLNQNSFYWFYLGVIAKETGHTEDELHRLFKGLFLPKRKMIWKGKEYMMSGSTTKLNKIEMGEYLDRICAETNVPIPEKKLAAMVEYPMEEANTTF